MFVVVEFNQASKRPSLYDTQIHDNSTDAENAAEHAREETAKSGRGEAYEVFELTEF